MASNFGYNAYSSTLIDVLGTAATEVTAKIDVNTAYTSGARVRFSDSSTPLTNYFEGVVYSYNYATGVIVVKSINVKSGSGSYSSWNVNLAGEKGAAGAAGAAGSNGAAGAAGSNGTNGTDGKGYDAISSSTINVLTNADTSGSWTMDTGKAYLPFSRIRVSFSATEYFEGMLTAYNSSTGAFTVSSIDLKVGSSSHSLWNISLSGNKGTNGSNGSNGTNGTNGKDYSGATSATSIDVLTNASTTFSTIATTTLKAWTAGSRVRFASASAPSTEYFEGVVSTYSSVTGVMDIIGIDVKVGTLTHADWNISLTGEPGTRDRYKAKTANYTLTNDDYTINCTANTFDLTLHTAVGHTNVFNIKNSGTGLITILTTGGQTVDEYLSGEIILSQRDNIQIQSNGANWIIL